MVKIVSPLHSYSAHGKLGDVVYTGKTARQYVKPSQANTENQGNIRQAFAAVQKITAILNNTTRADLRIRWGANWAATLAGQVLGTDLITWATRSSQFAALDATTRGKWDTEAEVHGITDTSINYAGDAPYSAGLAFFAVAATLAPGANFTDAALQLFG